MKAFDSVISHVENSQRPSTVCVRTDARAIVAVWESMHLIGWFRRACVQ